MDITMKMFGIVYFYLRTLTEDELALVPVETGGSVLKNESFENIPSPEKRRKIKFLLKMISITRISFAIKYRFSR